jgi:Family of unknown function (DUF6689)
MKYSLALGFAVAAIVAAPASAAPGIADISVSENAVTAHVELPGNVNADLELRFEQALGLTVDSIGISAKLVDPSDVVLKGRLPAAAGLPAAFPVVIAIEPPASGPLAFSGVVAIDLHTHNLTYVAGTPLRLFAAESGKAFQDITGSVGLGSYRTGANKGGFSEFLIAADLRPVSVVIEEKFKRLQAKLDAGANSIPSSVLAGLQSQLRAAKSLSDAGDALGAAETIQQFAEAVKQASGSAIPDVWRSARDVSNLAGDLRGIATTLRFSLITKASGGS